MKHVITTKLHVHAEKSWSGNVSFKALGADMSEYGYIHLCEVDVEVPFELPDDFSFTTEEIRVLKEQKKAIQAEANRKIVQIEERIQSLLCIEHKVAA